jgi:hypothetical protein
MTACVESTQRSKMDPDASTWKLTVTDRRLIIGLIALATASVDERQFFKFATVVQKRKSNLNLEPHTSPIAEDETPKCPRSRHG